MRMARPSIRRASTRWWPTWAPTVCSSTVSTAAQKPCRATTRATRDHSLRRPAADNELTAEIVTLRWDAQRARLSQVQSLQTSSPEFKGAKSVSEIALSRDGRFIYVGNRGESTLVVYRINAETGELTLVQRTRSGGEAPWHFEIHPSGKWLLVANYRSNSVDLFSIDTVSGMLTDTSESIATPAPVSVGFVN
jgi:6-phosphogluconolactonase